MTVSKLSIKKIINKLGYDIVGFHKIYYKKNITSINIEFLGMAGKTHTLNKLKSVMKLKSIKPVPKINDLTNNDISNLLSIEKEIYRSVSNSLLNNHKATLYIKKCISLGNKIIIKRRYSKDNMLFWDEGIFKEFLPQLLDVEETLLANYSKDFLFIILETDNEIAYKRYLTRNKLDPKKKYIEIHNRIIRESVAIQKFKSFLNTHNLKYITLDNNKINPDYHLLVNKIQEMICKI